MFQKLQKAATQFLEFFFFKQATVIQAGMRKTLLPTLLLFILPYLSTITHTVLME